MEDDFENETQKTIFYKLKENLRGMTIKQLVESTGFSRETVTRHIMALEYRNFVYPVRFGNVDVYCSNHRKVRDKDTIKLSFGTRTLFVNRLNNEFGDFIKIAETRKVGEKWEPKGSVIIPPDALRDVIKALESIEKRPAEINKGNNS